MNNQSKKNIILWSKRLIATLFIGVWIAIMTKIATLKADFNQQATYCIVSTMVIFGILTALFELIRHYEEKLESKTSE